MTFDELIDSSQVMLAVGSGGVGKTTTAAAMALRAAERGRRVVVVTVDPARRLADALGLPDGLSAEPQRVTFDHAAASTGTGEVWAMMLDPRTTFDRLIERESSHPDLTEKIRRNPIYDNLADGLSGTQEYLATEELYSLHLDDRFDLVVVDTPPSRHVLDIVDGPQRLVTLFDNRVYQLLTGRSSGAARVIGRTAQRFAKTVAGVVGAEVVENAIEFFTLFQSLEGGFRDRAVAVRELLVSADAAVVLVAGPKPDVIVTGIELARALRDRSMAPDAVLVNLMHPDPGPADVESAARPPDDAATRLRARVRHEREAITPLLDAVGDVTLVEIPLLAEDIHDAEGLAHVVAKLAAGRS